MLEIKEKKLNKLTVYIYVFKKNEKEKKIPVSIELTGL